MEQFLWFCIGISTTVLFIVLWQKFVVPAQRRESLDKARLDDAERNAKRALYDVNELRGIRDKNRKSFADIEEYLERIDQHLQGHEDAIFGLKMSRDKAKLSAMCDDQRIKNIWTTLSKEIGIENPYGNTEENSGQQDREIGSEGSGNERSFVVREPLASGSDDS